MFGLYMVFQKRKKKNKLKGFWGERGSNSRPQDNSLSYETYALANCATTP